MGQPLDSDQVQAAQRAYRSAPRLTDLQTGLPVEPRQEPQKSFAIQAAGTTDFNQPRPVFHHPGRPGSRSQSIDVPRATLLPSSQQTEEARSAQDVKFLHSGFSRFNPLKRPLGLRKSRPKNPSSVEKSSKRASGGGKTYSDGTEGGEQVRLKVYESFTQTPGLSDSPKRQPHNPTNIKSQSDNGSTEVMSKNSTIPNQNENPVAGQVENITRAIGASSMATAPKLTLPSGPDQNPQMPPDAKILVHGHQSCTGNHADLEKQLTTISQQLDREEEKTGCLMEENGALKHENWQLQDENNRLRKENEAIKANNVSAGEYDHLLNQFKELNRQCSNLVKENQLLRLDLKLESEKELMAAFQTLCCELANTCSRYSPGGEVVDMHAEAVRDIEDLLQSRDKISRTSLSSPKYRLALSMACLSQLLVETVFHDPAVDIGRGYPKDLWANNAMAGDMASLERYMYSPALNIEEYHRWRCMTVRFLSRSRKASDGYDRLEPVLRHFLRLHRELFQLSEDRLGDLESELRSSVMIKAVDLSLCLRKQRSLIVVRTFEALDEYHKSSDDRLCLVTQPELVRLTSPYGEETGVSVLVAMETQRFHKKGEGRSSSGAERRRKEVSLPFSKKAGKKKSSV